MTWLIRLALKIGIPARFAKGAVIAILVAIALAALGVSKCAYDRSVVANHEVKIERRAKPATDKAASERARDTIRNDKANQERHDVIAAQPDQPISPTSHALSCKRLRDLGRNPPACR